MYEQIKKPKENKSRAAVNSVPQKESNVKQGFGFVDNRQPHKASVQRKLNGKQRVSSTTDVIQRMVGSGLSCYTKVTIAAGGGLPARKGTIVSEDKQKKTYLVQTQPGVTENVAYSNLAED